MTEMPGPFYHGSPIAGLTELRSAADLGISGRHGPGGGYGIYVTPSRLLAEGYAGDEGVVYELRLHSTWAMRAEGFCFLGAISERLFHRFRSVGVDCLITGFLEEVVVFDAAIIEIVRTLPMQIDEVRAAIAEIAAIDARSAEKSLRADERGPTANLQTQLVSKRDRS
jgi:hypothetical protein